MNQESQLEQIDVGIDQAKAIIELGQSLDRLQTNKDFVKLINEGYLKDEAVRLVGLKADSNLQSPEHQKRIDDGIMGIAQLKHHLRFVSQMASQARQDLTDYEEARQEVLAEV